jgi:hypothetical protein
MDSWANGERNGKEQKGGKMAERLASANGDSKFVIRKYLLSFCDSKLAIQIEYSLLLIWNCQPAGKKAKVFALLFVKLFPLRC